MSHLALAEATKYTEGWTAHGPQGLGPLGRPAAHDSPDHRRDPGDLADVEELRCITYAKGASCCASSSPYVGRDAFFAGLHE